MLLPLAAINWSSPLFWAIMIGWILSVTLHEFAHGLVAYLGGDYTIRERGLLSLNPMQYANPLMTFVLPVLFLAMGAVPMVGAATYVNVNLLRNRVWRTATALAGPAVNFLLFVACMIPLYPSIGWVNSYSEQDWTPAQIFCGAMGVIELFACFINLIPVPPLDGFNAISPYLPPNFAATLRQPQIGLGILLLLFFVLSSGTGGQYLFGAMDVVLKAMRFDEINRFLIFRAYDHALFSAAP